MACRVFFPAVVAIARFPTAYAGTIFRFCVAFFVITYTGVGAIAIGFPDAPGVFARVCFAIFAKADLTHGGRCAIRLPKIGAVPFFYMAAIARAGTGVGLISVGFPAIPVMPQHVGLTALRTGGAFGAGRYAESTFLRFGVCTASVAGTDVAGVAAGFPLAPVVRPVRLTEEAIAAIAPCLFHACGFVPAFRPMILCKFFPAESAEQCVLGFGSIANLEATVYKGLQAV